MYIETLNETLLHELSNATNVWFAVALMSDHGLEIWKNISCSKSILVGINLPTPPNVLRYLLQEADEAKCKFKVYVNLEFYFHPKVYLIENKNGYKAYVGSGNFTKGGLGNNIELFLSTDNRSECENIKKWFEKYFEEGIKINSDYIDNYQVNIYNKRLAYEKTYINDLNGFLKNQESDSNQFFRQEHFDAFSGNKPNIDNSIAKEERKEVQKKLLELHQRLYPLLINSGIKLYPNSSKSHITSSYYHNPFVSRNLNGIWLYYGKSAIELAEVKQHGGDDNHLDNIRIQIIVLEESVGIWCTIGKDNGSRLDRRNLQRRLENKNDLTFFYSLIKNLDPNYFIEVAGPTNTVTIGQINNERQLHSIIKLDQQALDQYFIIGIDIYPNDNRISEDNIVEFIFNQFKVLYPIYEFIKFRTG